MTIQKKRDKLVALGERYMHPTDLAWLLRQLALALDVAEEADKYGHVCSSWGKVQKALAKFEKA